MILRDILEANKFLDSKTVFDKYIMLNEKFESSIVKNIANSDIFKFYPNYSAYAIPTNKTSYGNTDSKTLEKWLKKIGKNIKGDSYSFINKMHSTLWNYIDWAKVPDDAFELIDKADVRRKKYKDYFIFWFNDDDQLVGLTKGTDVFFITEERKAFTGEVEGDISEENIEDNISVYELFWEKIIGKDETPIKLKGEYKQSYRQSGRGEKEPKTIDLQRNNFLNICYGLSPESIKKYEINEKIRQRKENKNFERSDDEIRKDNITRYNKEKSLLISKKNSKFINRAQEKYNKNIIPALDNIINKELDDIKEIRDNPETYNFRRKNKVSLGHILNNLNVLLRKIQSYNNLTDENSDSYFKQYPEKYQKQVETSQAEILDKIQDFK